MVTDKLKHEIVVTSLNRMLRSNFFDICVVRDAAKILDLPCGGPEYACLRALHCVHWSNMSPDVRSAIHGLIREVLRTEALPLFSSTPQVLADLEFLQDISTPEPSIWKRLLGGKV